MTTTTAKKPRKLSARQIQKLRSEALDHAWHYASCNITWGFGTLEEAREAYDRFVEGWPRHASHVGRIEWMKAYRSAPCWGPVRLYCPEIKLPR
jgi:hypothetical protein